VRTVDDAAEWTALVDDALSVRESAQDKDRRLAQLRRDLAQAELPQGVTAELLGRLVAGEVQQ